MPFFSLPAVDETADTDRFEDLEPAPWVGVAVPVEALMARSASAAVIIKRVAVYRDGFELTVAGLLHPSVGPDDGCVDRWGMGRPGKPVPDEMLRVGLAWPDGGRATNLDEWGRMWSTDVEPEPTAHGLETNGGSGSSFEMSHDYWAWPVPEAGPLQLVVEWPAYGIAETVATLDGSLFAAAAERAYPVWADDADRPSHAQLCAVYAARAGKPNTA